MLSIKDKIVNEIIIKKSRFITYLFRVNTTSDVDNHLSNLNSKYSDATHICYAYIIDSVKRFSDNGEPGGTAGMPILTVLENKNLDHILCCVVRYFGGTKLGVNGLIRAYSSSCNEAINCSSIVKLIPGKLCSISFKYDDTKAIDNILKNSIINKTYESLVTYTFKVSLKELPQITNELKKFGNLLLLNDCFIENI